jgi:cyclase
MLTKRIIPCLDVKNGKVVKGINFKNLNIVGYPVELAIKYYNEGADELCFLDITASSEKRKTMVELVRKISKNIFIPFTVGGGIRTIEDIEALLKNGADKVTLCTEAVKKPGIIKEASQRFGSQCIVISLDVKKNNGFYEIYIYGGKKRTGLDAFAFAKKCYKLGAGELLVNSLDRDGTNGGYDLELIRTISESVKIPIIASSGAGNLNQIYDTFTKGKADAALAASIFHYDKYSIADVKKYLKKRGINIR